MKIRTLAACCIVVGLTGSPTYARAEDGYGQAERQLNPVEVVNNLPYSHGDLETAIEAFNWVAASRGWELKDIAAWDAFAKAVMARESGGCWNVFYAQRVGEGCQVWGRARGTAAGFGQVIFKSNRYLCPEEGLCSHWDIVASPWNSMTALVALIEHSGRGPWCYTRSLRAGRVCRLAP